MVPSRHVALRGVCTLLVSLQMVLPAGVPAQAEAARAPLPPDPPAFGDGVALQVDATPTSCAEDAADPGSCGAERLRRVIGLPPTPGSEE